MDQGLQIAASIGGTGLTVGFLMQFAFKRYISENDKKHEDTEKELDKKTDSITDALKDLTKSVVERNEKNSESIHSIKNHLSKIVLKMEIQEHSTSLTEKTVKEDHETIVIMRSQMEKLIKDMDNIYTMKREGK